MVVEIKYSFSWLLHYNIPGVKMLIEIQNPWLYHFTQHFSTSDATEKPENVFLFLNWKRLAVTFFNTNNHFTPECIQLRLVEIGLGVWKRCWKVIHVFFHFFPIFLLGTNLNCTELKIGYVLLKKFLESRSCISTGWLYLFHNKS